MNSIATIEDLLEVSAGLTLHPKVVIEKEDMTIMHSIARQVFKGTALTDRQCALMKEKLLKYKGQFENLDCDFEFAIDQLRKPLREIDRSKYIKIVDYPEDAVVETNNLKWIKIRFPFSKNVIIFIQQLVYKLAGSAEYIHNKGSHVHYFSLTELSAYHIASAFKDKNFEIDQMILNIHNEVNNIINNKENYIPGLYNGVLKNINPNALAILKEELGEPLLVPKIKLIDRHRRYGISFIDENRPPIIDLSSEIAVRDKVEFLCKPSKYRTNVLLESLYNLDRFPLLVVLDPENPEQELYDCFNFFRHILPIEEQSVLFRLSNSSSLGTSFNEYVKDNKLNNWVDKSTKVVYISKDKVPKLLINNEWSPIASVVFGSNLNRHVNSYINGRCDLIILRDEYESPMRKYSNYYG